MLNTDLVGWRIEWWAKTMPNVKRRGIVRVVGYTGAVGLTLLVQIENPARAGFLDDDNGMLTYVWPESFDVRVIGRGNEAATT